MTAGSTHDVGDIIAGRYRIEAILGEGASSTVYGATQLALSRAVAIKIIRAQPFSGLAEQRFLREAQAVSRLAHPNIVHIYDYGVDEATARAFLVLEQVEGETLVARLRSRGAFSRLETARIMAQVARALAHAHARGIAHRDVKPANLMLTDPGDGQGELVKVLAFGLAKMLGDEAQPALTAPGRPLGTLEFASPEQVLGQPTDPRSDLYSLGCVIYACASACAPWGGQDQARFQGPPPMLPGPLTPLSILCAELMTADAAQRPSDAAVVAARLEEIADASLESTRSLGELTPVERTAISSNVLVDLDRTAISTTGVRTAESGLAIMDATTDAAPLPTLTAPMVRFPASEQPPLAEPRRWPIALAVAVALGIVALVAAQRGDRPDPVGKEMASPSRSAPVAPAIVAIPARLALDIRSQPPGAAVMIDGVALGETPATIEISALPAEITLRKSGYRDRVITASIAGARLDLLLERAPAVARPTKAPPPRESASPKPYGFW